MGFPPESDAPARSGGSGNRTRFHAVPEKEIAETSTLERGIVPLIRVYRRRAPVCNHLNRAISLEQKARQAGRVQERPLTDEAASAELDPRWKNRFRGG